MLTNRLGKRYLKNDLVRIKFQQNYSINLSKKSLFLKGNFESELHKAFIAIKEMEYNKVDNCS